MARLGQTRGGSWQSMDQGQAAEHSTASPPAAWQSLPAWGAAALAPASCSGGSREEAETSVCPPVKRHGSPLGPAGSGDSIPAASLGKPCLPFPSHHRRPGALRHEDPGARGSHRHHNPPPPRQPGDQALLPRFQLKADLLQTSPDLQPGGLLFCRGKQPRSPPPSLKALVSFHRARDNTLSCSIIMSLS